jgi:hypothetical protein
MQRNRDSFYAPPSGKVSEVAIGWDILSWPREECMIAAKVASIQRLVCRIHSAIHWVIVVEVEWLARLEQRVVALTPIC